MNEKLLKISDLEVKYETMDETVSAVNGISLELDKGETLGLVGETGAGKTTTALSIMRLLPERTGRITSGEILFNGENLLKMKEEKLRTDIRGNMVSMIFQDPMTALNPVMSVGDQIAEAVRYHQDRYDKEAVNKRVDEVLSLVGISTARKNEYPHQFSGGMKQRVVIAIALSMEPELLIADEPTTALDVTIQAQVLSMISDLLDRLGMAMIMITHDLGVIAQICDSVAVMYAGEIIESGSLNDIFESDIHHPYTIGLFGAIPDLLGDAKRLSPIPGLMPDPSNLPDGCNFQSRCPHCMDICKKQNPKIFVDRTHKIACHLFDLEPDKGV